QPCRLGDITESFVYVPNRPAVPLDSEPLTLPLPATQMRKEAIGQWHRGTPFFRFSLTLGTPEKDASVKIDPALAFSRLQSGSTNSTSPRSGIERDQDEPRDVTPRSTVGALTLLPLPEAPSRPQKRCCL